MISRYNIVKKLSENVSKIFLIKTAKLNLYMTNSFAKFHYPLLFRSSRREVFRPSGLQLNYREETPPKVFSREYYKTFKNTYFEEHLQQTTASVILSHYTTHQHSQIKCFELNTK